MSKHQSYYTIEFQFQPPLENKWGKMPSFSYMRKSFAEGAWAMLKAHYNQKRGHRLLKDGEVVETIGKQEVKPNQYEKGV